MTIASSATAGIVLLILIVALIVGFGVCQKVRRLHTPLKIVIEDPSLARPRGPNATKPDIVISGYVSKLIQLFQFDGKFCFIYFHAGMYHQLLHPDTLNNVSTNLFYFSIKLVDLTSYRGWGSGNT